ncbi:MAG TPA: glycoside hydrolase family 127 protein [Rhizomicrobium sp.]|nr:glycoside hydrolase family 127 protein [Rhizomicrobium sp.]
MTSGNGACRRKFLAGAAAAPLVAAAGRAAAQGSAGPSQAAPPTAGTNTVRQTVARLAGEPFDRPIAFHRAGVPAKLQPFSLHEVRLGDGLFRDMHAANAAYLKRLPVDSLLHTFRVNAGLPSNAAPLGGWELPTGELRGHFVGHYLSACALGYASDGDLELKQRGDALVSGLAQCQAKLNQGGYLSAYSTEFYDRLQKGDTYVWAPFYTMHKLLAGLYDMHTLAGNQQALGVLTGLCGWVDNWTAQWDEEHMQRILNVEFGGMQETLYDLAALTGDDRWGRVGDRFTKKIVFNPLASARDELAGRHMNTHVPQVIGAARRYEISGDNRFHDVAHFFWHTVVQHRTYATGGSSARENWLSNPTRLSEEYLSADSHQECCCSYNMMKLTRHLFGWDPDVRYIDYYERNLLNHRLGTIRADGMNQYFLSLTPGAWRTFGGETDTFWCCNGTASEEYNKLTDTIYYNDGKNIWVNLFIASRLDWKERGIGLVQTTRFPEEAGTQLVLERAPAAPFAINLRIPSWTTEGARLLVNGKPVDIAPTPGTYMRIQRAWKKGDRIELQMPMALNRESFADNPSLQAVLYGPLVLAGQFPLGTVPMPAEKPHGPDVAHAAIEVPSLPVAGKAPQEWLKAEAGMAWRTQGIGRDIVFKPFYQSQERYAVYWKTV